MSGGSWEQEHRGWQIDTGLSTKQCVSKSLSVNWAWDMQPCNTTHSSSHLQRHRLVKSCVMERNICSTVPENIVMKNKACRPWKEDGDGTMCAQWGGQLSLGSVCRVLVLWMYKSPLPVFVCQCLVTNTSQGNSNRNLHTHTAYWLANMIIY